jgi:predicted small lipoprotein YifL
MVAVDSGVPDLSSLSHAGLVRIAAIGALVAALGLAGCGRKGGLDPPPGAVVADQTLVGDQNAVAGGPGPGIGPDGKAMAPAQGPQRRTWIDWLLD